MTTPTTPTTSTLADPGGVHFTCPDPSASSPPGRGGAATFTVEDPYRNGAFITLIATERMDDTDEGVVAEVAHTAAQAADLAEFLYSAICERMAADADDAESNQETSP